MEGFWHYGERYGWQILSYTIYERTEPNYCQIDPLRISNYKCAEIIKQSHESGQTKALITHLN
jgi:hypothetical protein